jgi:hypothetical protein
MPENKTKVTILEKLETLCEGLIYISEIDSEMTPFVGETINSESASQIIAALGKSRIQVEEIEFDKFFTGLSAEKEWLNAAERRQAKRWIELRKFLEENIVGLRVFRFGKTRLEIYVVGVGPEGRAIGVKAESVET